MVSPGVTDSQVRTSVLKVSAFNQPALFAQRPEVVVRVDASGVGMSLLTTGTRFQPFTTVMAGGGGGAAAAVAIGGRRMLEAWKLSSG